MLTLLEIHKAINDTVKKGLKNTEFSDAILRPEDVSEPIVRPSIKVQIDNSNNGRRNSCFREKTLTVRIYFFASDIRKYKIENLKMQDVLENSFLDGMYIEGAYIPINDVESDVTDTVLTCSFQLYLVELAEWQENVHPETGEPIEPMEELEMGGMS